MKQQNPKMIAAIAAIVLMAGAVVFLLMRIVPMAQEAGQEIVLTPTPVPQAPDSLLAVTPDPSKPTAEPDLLYGSGGQAVRDLQTRLTELGYYQGEIDGLFYNETKEAVIAFQQANGLAADGVVGENTKKVLFSTDAVPASPSR